MRRRTFIALAGGAALWPLAARAIERKRRIGTFGLAVGAACAFSPGITGQVLTFRTKA